MATPTNQAGSVAASYTLDAARSRFVVRASATGLLSAFGHSPTIAIRNFTGEASFDSQAPEQSSLQFRIDPLFLAITNEVNEKDRHEMERAMREDVLEIEQYPEIAFLGSASQAGKLADTMYSLRIAGTLNLHGAARSLDIPCTVTAGADTLRANGEFTIRQTEYGIHLVSVAGGTLKLKDELKFTFDIVAQRNQGKGD